MEIIHKITLYNSHPCSDMIKKYWIRNYGLFLLTLDLGILHELVIPFKRSDIKLLDEFLFENAYFIYDIQYYSSLGIYGSVRLIDLEDD